MRTIAKVLLLVVVLALVGATVFAQEAMPGATCTIQAFSRGGDQFNVFDIVIYGPDGRYLLDIDVRDVVLRVEVNNGSGSTWTGFPYITDSTVTFNLVADGPVDCTYTLEIKLGESGPQTNPQSTTSNEVCTINVFRDVNTGNRLYFDVGGVPEGAYTFHIVVPEDVASDIVINEQWFPGRTWSDFPFRPNAVTQYSAYLEQLPGCSVNFAIRHPFGGGGFRADEQPNTFGRIVTRAGHWVIVEAFEPFTVTIGEEILNAEERNTESGTVYWAHFQAKDYTVEGIDLSSLATFSDQYSVSVAPTQVATKEDGTLVIYLYNPGTTYSDVVIFLRSRGIEQSFINGVINGWLGYAEAGLIEVPPQS